jgi:hypothetical protein
MRFSEMATRLTGFSVPLFGVSWQPPKSDVAVAKGLIVFLEDRRVLFNPYHAEVEQHVISSLLEIRQELTRILSDGGIAKELQCHPPNIINTQSKPVGL